LPAQTKLLRDPERPVQRDERIARREPLVVGELVERRAGRAARDARAPRDVPPRGAVSADAVYVPAIGTPLVTKHTEITKRILTLRVLRGLRVSVRKPGGYVLSAR